MTENRPLVGIKLYDFQGDAAALAADLRSLGVNAVFLVRETAVRAPDFRQACAQHGIRVFQTIQVLMDEAACRLDPTLYAQDRQGRPAIHDWAHFVCPSKSDYLARKLDQVTRTVREAQPDGVSFDFLRQAAFWEDVRRDTLAADIRHGCYCPACRAAFFGQAGVLDGLPAGQASQWPPEPDSALEERYTVWKCGQISALAGRLAAAARAVQPDIAVNLHTVPWLQPEYGSGIRRLLGQDLRQLSTVADYLSPMCYASLLERASNWIHQVVLDVAGCQPQAGDKVRPASVLPCIQLDNIADTEAAYGDERFEADLRQALLAPAAGVLFFVWEWERLRDAAGRRAIIKRHCGGA